MNVRSSLSTWTLAAVLCVTACGGDAEESAQLDSEVSLPEHVAADEVVLTISGAVETQEAIMFDMDTLLEFPQSSFDAYDPWEERTVRVEGVLLRDLLQLARPSGEAEHLRLVARNDFEAQVRIHDAREYDYLLAHTVDGVRLDASEELARKAPLIIAIDFSSHPELDIDVYKHQLVWQLIKIVVE